MARLKSTAVWYDLPGTVAAYMPISAPSAVDALMNVGHTDALGNHRMAGKYTATPGVLPTWSAATGLTFNGSTQYLKTGVVPLAQGVILARFSGGATTEKALQDFITGAVNVSGGVTRRYVASMVRTSFPNQHEYGLGSGSLGNGYIWIIPRLTSGVLGISKNQGYLNGIADGGQSSTIADCRAMEAYIGAINLDNAMYGGFRGNVLSVLFASRAFSPAEMWLASRQMAYCEQNPDWNAWARRRRYYYAPSATAGRVGIYGRRGAVALPGGVSIRGGNHG